MAGITKQRGVMVTAAGMGMAAMLAASTAGLRSCDDKAKGDKGAQSGTTAKGDKDSKPTIKTEEVTVAGKKFSLELALDADTRFKGLTGRTEIPAEGGMLFVFPRPVTTSFVMRDCPVPIDIIYLDATGRVVSFYKMEVDPRKDSEKVNDDPATDTNKAYEARLKKYPSEYDTQFVIELKGNTLDELKIKKNDKVTLDVAKLKKMAK
jgi:uncharacterized membrane protein (UPF0127 family)